MIPIHVVKNFFTVFTNEVVHEWKNSLSFTNLLQKRPLDQHDTSQ